MSIRIARSSPLEDGNLLVPVLCKNNRRKPNAVRGTRCGAMMARATEVPDGVIFYASVKQTETEHSIAMMDKQLDANRVLGAGPPLIEWLDVAGAMLVHTVAPMFCEECGHTGTLRLAELAREVRRVQSIRESGAMTATPRGKPIWA